jgi:acetylornithine deacetylase/succinyl-diaminopimelate desuccinylase-like protein
MAASEGWAMSGVETYLRDRHDEILADLMAFTRIPSVSTDPAYADGVRAGAEWVAARMRTAGLEAVAVRETGGHPCVTGHWLHAAGAPTILIYGHYDVQPPDPAEKWLTPAFEPTVRDGRLYARGVSDDKGPMLIPLWVAQAFLATEGRLPINVKFLIEGEEEVGSAHLSSFVERHAAELGADFVLSADGAMWRADLPTVTVASRGICTVEATLTGAAKDLHSGRHGGSAPNPLAGLARLVASLHDETGAVAVAGFHDGIVPIGNAARIGLAGIPFDEAAYLDEIGADGPGGEDGLPLLERQWTRPTLELNGLWGGYTGPGSKTVIPSEAHVKISCRLVPGQEPEAVQQAIRRHLETHCPPSFRLAVTLPDHCSRAYAIRDDHPALVLAEDVLEEVLGRRPLRVRMGATIPIGETFEQVLGIDTVFFSFSTADEDYHAPNEFFRLSSLANGLAAWARYWQRLGQQPAR